MNHRAFKKKKKKKIIQQLLMIKERLNLILNQMLGGKNQFLFKIRENKRGYKEGNEMLDLMQGSKGIGQ